ncbi:MAG: DUF362 domain-containing protein [Thermoleophilia bacterium]
MKTSPGTAIADYGELMRLAGYGQALPAESKTLLNINLSWDAWFPACSTTPWQLEGVLGAILADGYSPDSLSLVYNGATAGVGPVAETNNGLTAVADKFGLDFTRLNEPAVPWSRYEPKAGMLVLDRLCEPLGIQVPDMIMGANIVQLPTVKSHALTGTAGAMENAVGGVLRDRRQLNDGIIHEVLVDLLAIQQEVTSGVFAVMDGTFCGDGPGPRTLLPFEKSYILAGSDPVAIDAVAATMMGFNPMAIKYISLAHERGLGCAVLADMELVGEDISGVNFHFAGVQKHTARREQITGHHGLIDSLDRALPGSPSGPWPQTGGRFYEDYYWYPFVGWPRVGRMAETGWGQLLQDYLPEGARLEKQGRGKGALLALGAATALLGMSAVSRVARLAGGRQADHQ